MDQNLFFARVRKSDGTFGLTAAVPLPQLVSSVKDLMPFDIVYAATLSESGKISQEAVGYFSLTFVPLKAGQDGERSGSSQESESGFEIGQASSGRESQRDAVVSREPEFIPGGAPVDSAARSGDRESEARPSGEFEARGEAQGRTLSVVRNGNYSPPAATVSADALSEVQGEMREASAISLRDLPIVEDKPLRLRTHTEGPYNKPRKGRFNFGWFGNRD